MSSKRKNRGAAQPSQNQVQVPTTSLAADSAVDQSKAEAAATEPKKVRTNRPAGLGHPNAKKLVNPQHTLELKKAAVAKLGGAMVWTNKNWSIKVPAGEFSLPSRELAALSVATLLDRVSKAPPKAPEAPAAEVQETEETEAEATA